MAANSSTLAFADALANCVQGNPELSLVSIESGVTVQTPWGDETLEFVVSAEQADLVDALNACRFPPRFSAIWHRDSNDVEFIFGVVTNDYPLRSRKFSFAYDGSEFVCEFSVASERLKSLATSARQTNTPPTETEHRNILNIKNFLSAAIKKPELTSDHLLLSFFVRNMLLPEDTLPLFCRHLNFFMRFFDSGSPFVMIHDDSSLESSKVKKPLRTVEFPSSIAGRKIDPYLLAIWESGANSDPFRRFIYSFQILEYAAFYYLREEIHRSIRRALLAPSLHTRIDDTCRVIMDIVAEEKLSDQQKIASVVGEYVDVEAIWNRIQLQPEFFVADTEFDGGITLPALIRDKWTLDDFQKAWMPKLTDTLTRLRNALVHAREQRMSRTIAPTKKNRELLRPWSNLVFAVASQVLVYGEL